MMIFLNADDDVHPFLMKLYCLDRERLYRPGEAKMYENLECEWPILVCFLVIDGVFKNCDEQVKENNEVSPCVLVLLKLPITYPISSSSVFTTTCETRACLWRLIVAEILLHAKRLFGCGAL